MEPSTLCAKDHASAGYATSTREQKLPLEAFHKLAKP